MVQMKTNTRRSTRLILRWPREHLLSDRRGRRVLAAVGAVCALAFAATQPVSEPVWNRVLGRWSWDFGIRWSPLTDASPLPFAELAENYQPDVYPEMTTLPRA